MTKRRGLQLGIYPPGDNTRMGPGGRQLCRTDLCSVVAAIADPGVDPALDFDHDAVTILTKHAGPAAAAPFLTELRAWGGALSRPLAVPNAVGGRDTVFSLLAISDPAVEDRARSDGLLDAMEPWGTGGRYLNFTGVEDTSIDAVRRFHRPEDFARLRRVKATYDPDNVFRINFNIPLERSER